MIDTIMAGHHSANALAAIGIGTSIFNPVIVLVIGIMLVFNPMTAQLNGKEDWFKLRQLFHNGLFLSLLLVPPSLLLLLNADKLLELLNADASVIPITSEYIKALCWGLPGLYLFFALRFTNEGLFGNKFVMYIALSALPINIIANYWFIYGGFGLEAMGAVGVGWATTVVYLYMFVALLIFTAKSRRYRHIGLFSCWHKPSLTTLKETLRIGIPTGLAIGMEVGLFATVGLLISSYAVHQIAGHQIALNISTMCYMLPLGLSVAITARVGFNIGKGKPKRAKNAGHAGIILALLITCGSMLILLNFSNFIVSAFTDDQTVINMAIQLLFFAALFQLSDGTQTASAAALRGLKDTKIPLLLAGCSFWLVGFPTAYYLAEIVGWGLDGYWIGLITGLSMAALLMTLRFIRKINNIVHIK
jgi:MATE family multidrug resistance protein